MRLPTIILCAAMLLGVGCTSQAKQAEPTPTTIDYTSEILQGQEKHDCFYDDLYCAGEQERDDLGDYAP